jgi:GTPase-associated protein 1
MGGESHMNANYPGTSDRAVSLPPIHQLLHGYDNGHRLLAASEAIAPELLRLIDRLSDATGSSSHPDDDGYLTGYPLSNDRYAFARTWPAWEVQRPNCVWTHTLLLSAEHLKSADDIREWITLFQRPEPNGLERYGRPILPVEAMIAPLEQRGSLFSVDTKQLSYLCHALYSRNEGLSWIEITDRVEREEVALAVWTQQWPALRRHFSFCTGALEPRRVGDRPFDLCLVPTGASAAFLSVQSAPDPPAVDTKWLVEDLIRPSEAFRSFVAFVAGGGTRRTTMLSLTRIWRLLNEPTDLHTLFETIDREVSQLGPRPEQARRLKRALFRLPTAAVASLSPPSIVLEALLRPSLHAALAPEDVPIEPWVENAWNEDPEAVLSLYENPLYSASASELGEAIIQVATPSDLITMALMSPELAGLLLSSRQSDEWWSAWAALAPSDMINTVAHLLEGSFDLATAQLACRALVASSTSDALHVWERIATFDEPLAVRSVVRSLAIQPDHVRTWQSVLSSHMKELVDILSSNPTESELGVLAEVLEPMPAVVQLGLWPWTPLDHEKWRDALHRGVALLFLAGVASSDRNTVPFFARIYAVLYARLANTSATEEWSILSGRLSGSKDDWDRSKRLARTVLKKAKLTDSEMSLFLVEVEHINHGAADRLRTEAETGAHGKRRILGIDLPW